MNNSNFDWLKYITACLNSTNYCCIATVDDIGVWSNPVYFAWDQQFNFYFISQIASRHMQNIQKNGRVSLSIYKSEQEEYLCGIQMEGNAVILQGNVDEINQAYKIYYARLGKEEQAYYENGKWNIVKITPEKMYYFDDRFFEENRQEVPDIGNLF